MNSTIQVQVTVKTEDACPCRCACADTAREAETYATSPSRATGAGRSKEPLFTHENFSGRVLSRWLKSLRRVGGYDVWTGNCWSRSESRWRRLSPSTSGSEASQLRKPSSAAAAVETHRATQQNGCKCQNQINQTSRKMCFHLHSYIQIIPFFCS